MKKNEIVVGGLYSARISNRYVTVKVLEINTVLRHAGYDYAGIPKPYREVTVYKVKNLNTGRTIQFKSAARFRNPTLA